MQPGCGFMNDGGSNNILVKDRVLSSEWKISFCQSGIYKFGTRMEGLGKREMILEATGRRGRKKRGETGQGGLSKRLGQGSRIMSLGVWWYSGCYDNTIESSGAVGPPSRRYHRSVVCRGPASHMAVFLL